MVDRAFLEEIENDAGLDVNVEQFGRVAAKVAKGRRGEVLRGEWLGHALHPALTDLTLGCWVSAGLLDLIGGKRSRVAAQRLIGVGLLTVPLTAASGTADWTELSEQHARRVGVVHAAGNTAVAAAYLLSWRSRRAGHHLRGTAFALAGLSLGALTAYLGAHLAFGPRGSAGASDAGADGATLAGAGDLDRPDINALPVG